MTGLLLQALLPSGLGLPPPLLSVFFSLAGNSAFEGCSWLANLTVGSSVTSIGEIIARDFFLLVSHGQSAFEITEIRGFAGSVCVVSLGGCAVLCRRSLVLSKHRADIHRRPQRGKHRYDPPAGSPCLLEAQPRSSSECTRCFSAHPNAGKHAFDGCINLSVAKVEAVETIGESQQIASLPTGCTHLLWMWRFAGAYAFFSTGLTSIALPNVKCIGEILVPAVLVFIRRW